MTGISRDEWLAALEEAQQSEITNDPTLLTLRQCADMFGLHYNTARRHLRTMVEKGLAEKGTKRILAEDGRVRLVSAWRLAKSTKKR